MARLPKYADALVSNIVKAPKQWNNVRNAGTTIVDQDKILDVRKILADFSPEKYLLTHATIVASVDVEPSPLAKDGTPYFIKPECSKYVNQNGDSWERGLLLNTFKSFVGAYNYLEHVQIPQLSKGRIIDAVARPINNNESVYIDILVATNRIHRDLVGSIENGELGTLSMGCSIKYSRCSMCGKKASDEADLCDCIRYLKNQYFMDNDGNKRIIAELCGDKNDPDSNVFIEASWVKNPAFQGAVLRNIVLAKGEEQSKNFAEKIERAYVARKQQPTVTSIDGFLKSATVKDLDTLAKKTAAMKQARSLMAEAGIDPFDVPGDQDEEDAKEVEGEPNEQSKQEQPKPETKQQMIGEMPNHAPSDIQDEAQETDDQPNQKPLDDQAEEDAQAENEGDEPAEQAQEGDEAPDAESDEGGEEPKGEAPEGDDSDESEGDEEQGESPEGEESDDEGEPEGDDEQGEEAPDYQQQFEQVLQGGDQGEQPEQGEQPPEQGAQKAPPKPKTDSLEGIKDQIKKEIRQSIIEELTKEIQEENKDTYLDSHDGNESWDTNDNMVKAFVKVYQPKTGFSRAKLSSIFNVLYLQEQGQNLSKIAYGVNDVVDLFEFVDRFQVTQSPLQKWHYGVLRKVGKVELSNLDAFKLFLNLNNISNKKVVSALVKKAAVLREYFNQKTVIR